jgi:hypothetical protein
MSVVIHFSVFILVSLFAFIYILKFVLRNGPKRATANRVMSISLVVVVGGMLFAKFGANADFPWWIYYGVPVAITLFLPPLVFHMNLRETTSYLLLSFMISPLIHLLFSFFLGWKEYMPFIPIPSIWELLR